MKIKIKYSVYFTVIILLSFIACKETDHSNHNHEHGMEQSGTQQTILPDEIVQMPNTVIISSQSTFRPVMSDVENVMTLYGNVAIDERRTKSISSRTGGRIENLFIKYDYVYVKKGQKILELYSPDLLSIEEEYLYLLKNTNDKALAEKIKEKMLLLGITEQQIKNLEQTGQPDATVEIFSPEEGYVFFKAQKSSSEIKSPGKNMQGSMQMAGTQTGQEQKMQMNTASQIREGTYVNAGQTLFSINDLKEVWIFILLEGKDVSSKQNIKIKSEMISGSIQGKIDFVETIYENSQPFTRARIYVKNGNGYLKPNSLVTAEIEVKETNLLVPSTSVLNLGKEYAVWIKTGTVDKGTNIFQLQKVSVGNTNNGKTSVLAGINSTDEIAIHAGYLLDSESLIRTK